MYEMYSAGIGTVDYTSMQSKDVGSMVIIILIKGV